MMFNDEADEVIKEFFDSLRNRYQNNLESVKASEFVFNYVRFFSITNVIKHESRWIICRFSWLDKKQTSNKKSHQ